MNSLKYLLTGLCFVLLIGCQSSGKQETDPRFISFVTDPKRSEIQFYWKDEKGKPLMRLDQLKEHVSSKGKKLRFAMNGGMYMEDTTPLGLFIENGKTVRPLNTRKAGSNFYLQPNGVFLLKENREAQIVETGNFKPAPEIKFATQSGPMLVINGELNPVFRVHSKNVNVRNGVGLLPDGKILFVMSRVPVNFYDFAAYFKEKNCKQALYLDGYVSRTYLPEKDWIQLDGDFGVIIGVIE